MDLYKKDCEVIDSKAPDEKVEIVLDDSVKHLTLKFLNSKDNGEVDKAIITYIVVVLISIVVLYYGLCIRIRSAFIISIIIGQILLNVICLPTRLNFWTELNSSVALYSFIQLATPLTVFIYAIACGVGDKRSSGQGSLISP